MKHWGTDQSMGVPRVTGLSTFPPVLQFSSRLLEGFYVDASENVVVVFLVQLANVVSDNNDLNTVSDLLLQAR